MTAVLLTVFWVCLGLIFLPLIVYPVIIFLIGLIRPRRSDASYTEYPFVSVMVAARNEEKCIGDRIKNLLSQDYPVDRFEVLVASDVSTDATDEIVRSYEADGIRFLRSEERLGKSALMVELSKIAKGELLVFTDANTLFKPDTVRELVEPFADQSVGCVVGSKQNSLDSVTCESVYWRYEQLLKKLGSRIGAVLGATGAVFAVRKCLYNPSDPSRADDFETAVSTRIQGFACLYNPRAIAAEPTPDNFSQYHRMVRIVSWMVVSAMTLLREALAKHRYALSLQMAVHKIIRWNIGFFAVFASISGLMLALTDSVSNYVFLCVAAFSLIAVSGRIMGNRFPSLLRLPYFFWLMCVASLVGIARIISSSAKATWDHSSR